MQYWYRWSTTNEVEWRETFRLWMKFVNDYKISAGVSASAPDSGFMFQTYGFGLVRELELLQEAGFTPLEVLRAATTKGAELLGIEEEVGTLEVGKLADILVHDENPLNDFKLLYGTGAMRARRLDRFGDLGPQHLDRHQGRLGVRSGRIAPRYRGNGVGATEGGLTGIVGTREAVPEFVLLTGSLGSGKTTLLCDYLSLANSAGTGVIVNEAGEINIDGAIVSSGRRDLAMTLLGNGCVCCSLGDDLHSAIDELLAVRRRSDATGFRRIVLETSGLAMPGPILRSLMRYDRAEYRIRIVSTLDALAPMTDEVMFPIRSAQLTAATSIVFTKLDWAGNDQVKAKERVAKQFNPGASRIVMADRIARARAVFDPMHIETATALGQFEAIAATVHSRLGVFFAEWPAAVSWGDLTDWLEDLASVCGDRLLRAKGLVAVAGAPRCLLIDSIGATFAEPRWLELDHSSRLGIVIIARDIGLAELTALSAHYPEDVSPVVKSSTKRAA